MLNFIVNVKSGKGRGEKALKKIRSFCDKNNVSYTAHITQEPNHATRIAKALCENNAHTIVAVGGDGTFSEVLNGMQWPGVRDQRSGVRDQGFEDGELAVGSYQLSEDSGADSKTATQSAPPPCVTLGFIPAGRGNDYAKATGLNLDPIKALADILLGEIVYSDYIEVGEMRCLNVCGTGLDVAVLERVAGKSGKITYLRSLIWCIKHFTPYALDVTVNGEKSRHECIMAGVCNGTTFGGGIKLSPLSKTDDGKLDLIIMRLPANGKIMPALFKFQKGKHLEMEYTTHIVCDEVSAVSADESAPYPIQLDGEIYYGKTLSCRVVKGGLRTFKTTNNE